jgi:hypothetical protein
LTLTAYFDESGTHHGSEAVAVAGYLSTSEGWLAFRAEWEAALANFNIPMFHMTDFALSQQQFKGWPEPKRRECFARLLEIINRNVIGSVGMVIPTRAFEVAFAAGSRAFVGGPYGLAAMQCAMALGQVMRLSGIKASIHYVFESGAEGYGQVAQAFQTLLDDAGSREYFRVRSLAFQNKLETVPLQAADILAYELYKQTPKQLGIDPRAPRHFSLNSLRAMPSDWGYSDTYELAKWSHVISIRAGLSKKVLHRMPPDLASPGATIPISIEEFQKRWKWWHRFNGRRPAIG